MGLVRGWSQAAPAGVATRIVASLILASVLMAPERVSAQGRPTAAHVEFSAAATRIHGDATLLGSAALLLDLAGPLSLGGGATMAQGTRALPGPTPGADLRLRMGYGGLLVQWRLAEAPDRSVWLRLLAGAGSAKVDLALVGTRIGADNFGVIAPELGAAFRLVGPISLGGALGYRTVFGVEDLPGVTPADLRGPTGRILASVRVF